MIHTATQLKAKIRNLSGGNSNKAQGLIRIYFMERFLERISLSPHREKFILKGGMLVASLVGLDLRATMDIDTTIRAFELVKDKATEILEEIMSIELDDDVSFQITKVTDIMEEFDYPGIRFAIEATLENMKQAISVDLSTGDAITPEAIEYEYKLMFEDRTISLFTYNVETLLAEKLETIMTRSIANTRLRDFYDIHMFFVEKLFEEEGFKQAFRATCHHRKTEEAIPELPTVLAAVREDESMKRLWANYVRGSFYVDDVSWDDVMDSVERLAKDVE